MIVLDTNIISALMQPQPNDKVIAWLDIQQPRDLYLPSIVIAEIRYGLQRMPVGVRQAALSQQFLLLVNSLFADRILPFGQHEAEAYAVLRAARESMGRPMSMGDAQIAAIAHVHHYAVATRNIKDFEGCGIGLINPFE